jgi:hypothetical protein
VRRRHGSRQETDGGDPETDGAEKWCGHRQFFLIDVAVIELSVSTTPSTVTSSPSSMAVHDAALNFVSLVVRTVRPLTTNVSVGHWPWSDEIAPLTVGGAGGAAAWLIATSAPPITMAPVRDAVEVFSATLNEIVALPVPSEEPVSVIHDGLAEAVQVQLDAEAVTVMFPVRPPAGASTVDGDTVNEQAGGAAAAWLTVTVWVATVSEALRGDVVVWAAAEYWTVPFPLPLAPDVTVSHDAELVAVHAHPLGAVTVMAPLPPAAGTDSVVLETA